MASDVMSLFGLNPNTIQQNRLQEAGDTAARMNPYYAAGRASGMLMGAGAGSALGLQTEEMKEASNVKSALQGVDLETPEGLRKAAQQLSVNGDYARAMALVSAANNLEAEQLTATRETEERALGLTNNIIVEPARYDELTYKTIPAVQHSITQYYDGSVVNNTTGKTYNSMAEMNVDLSSQVGDGQDGVEKDTTRTPEQVLNTAKNLSTLTAEKQQIEDEINRVGLQYGDGPNSPYYQEHVSGLSLRLQNVEEQIQNLENK